MARRQPTADQRRCRMSSQGSGAVFPDSGRIVIVGASLAGLNAAQTLRAEGFRGPLTLIGEEPYLPYDRPPLTKAVLTGWVPAAHTMLPRRETLADVEWRLGGAAVGAGAGATKALRVRRANRRLRPPPSAPRARGGPPPHTTGR